MRGEQWVSFTSTLVRLLKTVSQHHRRQADEAWLRWVDFKLPEHLGPEGCEERYEVQRKEVPNPARGEE